MRAVLAEMDALAAEVAEILVPPKQSIRHRHTTAGRFKITSVTKVYASYLLPPSIPQESYLQYVHVKTTSFQKHSLHG